MVRGRPLSKLEEIVNELECRKGIARSRDDWTLRVKAVAVSVEAVSIFLTR